MSVQIADDVETIIREKVESGLYPSADEVLREALWLLDEHDRLTWLRAALGEGEEGEAFEYTPERREHIRQEAICRFRDGEAPNSGVLP